MINLEKTSLSLGLYIISFAVSLTYKDTTNKVAAETFYVYFKPPAKFYEIWVIFYSLTTLFAIIWIYLNNSWSDEAHFYFQIYCSILGIWIYFWNKRTIFGMSLCTLIFSVYVYLQYLIFQEILDPKQNISSILISNVFAFQLGWYSSSILITWSIFFIYGPTKFRQESLAKVVWPTLIILHYFMITTLYQVCSAKGVPFLDNTFAYFPSLAWCLIGMVYVQKQQFKSLKKK
ncbi:hypothetical protein pb186bvf_005773 [Paramecium bursaria]